jgi:hypothetical protein
MLKHIIPQFIRIQKLIPLHPKNPVRVLLPLSKETEMRERQAVINHLLGDELVVERAARLDDVTACGVAVVLGEVEGVVLCTEDGEGEGLGVSSEEAEETLEVAAGLGRG